ncbi:ATP-binding protein [Planktothricoides raciborskii]|uniref:AAA family ATPase n=1 Tax=Planktothricoides raciborskii FACHB-1370 TaxID=2949576 RepID=A0ABR8EMJ7_9CYAN|nr:ATP-binding protein [Planktothricoides raciborskii]MBD2547735.1 AAA family ATPase [Planktothricoides raciborskii FACHB-1370]MBD2586173.1 AAA family ATPase [Planktothricoides raciborskii FACHB-1261]
MDITDVLNLAEALIFMKTGKHLDHLQKAVLQGTFEGKTYTEIAAETYQSEGHVRNTGSELWKVLSAELKEEINKSNFRAVIEKVENNFSSATFKGDVTFQSINFCRESKLATTGNQQPEKKTPKQHLNLGDAPEITAFYGRKEELATLQNWILEKNSRLIAILGLRGIGKTTLALKIIEQIKPEFDYIIYRSLRFSPTPETTLSNLLEIFSPSDIPNNIETQICQLLEYLRQYRCLIVLDDVQMLFTAQKLAGHYKIGGENYQRFFKLMAEVSHNSCLILIGSEKPREIANYEKENKYCCSLVLSGLGIEAEEILKEQDLSDESIWESLIEIYQGNPHWLKLTATLIHELCGGRVADFLQFEMPIISDSLAELLDDALERLTEAEKSTIYHISQAAEPVSLGQIFQEIQMSSTDLFNVMHSLKRRFLVEDIPQDKINFFTVNPVFKAYGKKDG